MKIEISCDHPHLRFPRRETIRAIRSVLRRAGRRFGGISVVYTNDPRILQINQKHLKHGCVTDVITFELEQTPEPETEIYINLDRARVQAKQFGETYSSETQRLLIHGLLHVLGYKDKSKREKIAMTREEDAVLKELKSRKN